MKTSDPKNFHKSLALKLLLEVITGYEYISFFAATIVIASTQLLPPFLYKRFTSYIYHPFDLNLISLISLGLIIALSLFISCSLFLIIKEWLRTQLEAFLRTRILTNLAAMPLEELERCQRGEWIERISNDLMAVERFLTETLPEQIKGGLIVLGVSLLFLGYSGLLGLFPLGFAILLSFINHPLQAKLKPILEELRSLHGQVYQNLLENFEGLSTIRSFSGEKLIQKKFEQRLKMIKSKSMKMIRGFAILIAANESTSYAVITLLLGATILGLKENLLSMEEALIYPFYLTLFFNSLAGVIKAGHDWNQFFTKGGRLASLIYGHPQPVNVDWQYSMPNCSNLQSIHFIKVSLEYIGYPPFLIPFDVYFSRKEVVAIIGPSGCGKSTFLEFLAGLRAMTISSYEWIDTNGNKYEQISSRKLYLPTTIAAYVPQRPYFFEGTIAENLYFHHEQKYSSALMWEALEKAHLAAFMHERGGLDYRLMELGSNLSEGQKYRLALARAILTDKPFLLLDEPFASLDPFSIKAVCELLINESKHRGVIVVTHSFPPQFLFNRLIDFGQFINSAIN